MILVNRTGGKYPVSAKPRTIGVTRSTCTSPPPQRPPSELVFET